MITGQKQRAPALRFKDENGRDYPDWEEKLLGDIAKFSKGKGISKSDVVTDGTLKCIRYGELYTHYGTTISSVISSTDIPPSQLELSNKNDVIIPSSGETASDIATAACLRLDGVALGGDINIIRCQQNGVFLAYYLNYKKPDIARLAQGISVIHLYASQLRLLRLGIPSKKEQQKIATFLSAVDTKIGQLNRKQSLLEQYKKGMMQKLFSQEIRFKDEDGRDYPEWEMVKFGNLYSFKTTNSFSRDKLNYTSGLVRNIHYGDIHTKYKARFQIKEEQVPYLNPDIDLNKVSASSYCREGDLAIADASEDYTAIGKTVELVDLNNEPVLSGLHTLLARLDSDRIHIGYGAYMMAANVVKQQIRRIAHGTKVLGISAGRMKKVELPVPCVKEQQKIADFLSALDRKIELVAGQIKQTHSFRQGLLQQMFI